MGAVATRKSIQVFKGADLKREEYAHLDIRRTVISLAYVPLLSKQTLVGAIELISFHHFLSDVALRSLAEVVELAGPALAAALAYENERNATLHSISRVTQMYNLEKVFNSTLEMDELLALIGKKFQEVLNVQAVNLWMVNGDSLELMRGSGIDPTVQLGMAQNPGEGVAGDISDNGEPVLIDGPH